MTWMQLTIKRLKSRTPKYFSKLRSFCLWYSSSASAVITINSTFNLQLPDLLVSILGYSIAGATFLGFGASLTTTDQTLQTK